MLNFKLHINILEQKLNKIVQRAFMFDRSIIPPKFFKDMIKTYIIPHIMYAIDIIYRDEKARKKIDLIYR